MDPLLTILAMGGVSAASVLCTLLVLRARPTQVAAAPEPAPPPSPELQPQARAVAAPTVPARGRSNLPNLDYALDDDTMDSAAPQLPSPRPAVAVDDDEEDHPTVLYAGIDWR